MKERQLVASLWALAVGSAIVWSLKALVPESALYRDVLTDAVLIRLGALTKLLFLALAAMFASRNAFHLEAGNPARLPWLLLALGFTGFAAGQAVLTVHQVVWLVTPFPSAGDALFLTGYPCLIAGFAGFVRAYRQAYPVGSAAGLVRLALAAAVVFAALGYRLLSPILAAPATRLERLLNAAYPSLDFVLLIPVLVLLRITWGFRGGRVWRPWATLLTGGVFMSAGDIGFAYFSVMGQRGLDPAVHAGFILGYFLLAEGTRRQYRLLVE